MSHLISATRFPDLLAGPPEATAAWNAFSALVVEPPLHVTATYSEHVIGLQLSGTCRLRREMNGRSAEGWSGPGSVNVIPARRTETFEGRGHRGTSRAIALFVPEAFLSRVIAQDWDREPRSVELTRRFLARDPVIEGLLARLAFEARHGSPSGSIYAESACEFLAHHLIHAHSSLAAPAPLFSGGLAPRSLKLVVEYVEEHLAHSLTLRRLSAIAGVSPRHFERAFRQELGVPVHAYVLQKRLAAARHLLLAEPELTINEIAERAGFSSSSHLGLAFRRETGYTPRMFRRLHARSTSRTAR